MAAPAAGADVATLEELLLQMWRIRAFETRAMQLFEEKLIRGSVHPYIGMEAVAVGACAALGPQDYITSTHRDRLHPDVGMDRAADQFLLEELHRPRLERADPPHLEEQLLERRDVGAGRRGGHPTRGLRRSPR